jgi:hypothetical protein
MSVSGYNLEPGVNDEHVIDLDYDERTDEITMFISNGQDGEEITLTVAEFKALIRQMTAIAEYIERQAK